MQQLEIRAISAAEARPLRHQVLRQGQPPETAIFEADNAEETFHLAAMLDGRIIAVGSFMHEPMPARSHGDAWRLRGMAVAAEVQGQGIGRQLLVHAVDILCKRGCDFLWCNARETAVGFYKRLGFTTCGEFFQEKGIPHIVMWKSIVRR